MTTTSLHPQLLHLLGSRLNLSAAETAALHGGDYAAFFRERLASDPSLGSDPMFAMLASTLSAAGGGTEDEANVDGERAPPTAGADHDGVDDDTARRALAAVRSIAAILGACACWGQDGDCPLCDGHGAPGYRRSRDPHLFLQWVEPTLRRLGLRLVRRQTTVRTAQQTEE